MRIKLDRRGDGNKWSSCFLNNFFFVFQMMCESFTVLNRCKNNKFPTRLLCVRFFSLCRLLCVLHQISAYLCHFLSLLPHSMAVDRCKSVNKHSWKKPHTQTPKKRERRMPLNWVLDSVFLCMCVPGWWIYEQEVKIMKENKSLKKNLQKFYTKEPKSISSIAVNCSFFFTFWKGNFCFPFLLFGSVQHLSFILSLTSDAPAIWFYCSVRTLKRLLFFISKSLFLRTLFSLFAESTALRCGRWRRKREATKKGGKFAITFLFYNWRLHHFNRDNSSTTNNNKKVFDGKTFDGTPRINSLTHTHILLLHCFAEDIIIIEDKSLSVKMRDKQWNDISRHHTITPHSTQYWISIHFHTHTHRLSLHSLPFPTRTFFANSFLSWKENP